MHVASNGWLGELLCLVLLKKKICDRRREKKNQSLRRKGKSFAKFSLTVPVVSAHLCRDSVTGKSLRYAYVNFDSAITGTKNKFNLCIDSIISSLGFLAIDDESLFLQVFFDHETQP